MFSLTRSPLCWRLTRRAPRQSKVTVSWSQGHSRVNWMHTPPTSSLLNCLLNSLLVCICCCYLTLAYSLPNYAPITYSCINRLVSSSNLLNFDISLSMHEKPINSYFLSCLAMTKMICVTVIRIRWKQWRRWISNLPLHPLLFLHQS